MRIYKATVCASVLFIGGCATATKIPLPNNQEGLAIECDQVAYCYKKAQEVCPAGYEMIDKGSRTEGAMSNGLGILGQKQSLIVQCKK